MDWQVSPQASRFPKWIAPVIQSKVGNVIVGLAMMNLANAPVTVKLTVLDEDGKSLAGGSVDVQIPSQGHVAKYLSQYLPNLDLSNFRGSIIAETTGQIAATVIRQSSSPQELATLPVAELVP